MMMMMMMMMMMISVYSKEFNKLIGIFLPFQVKCNSRAVFVDSSNCK